jgi:hypothetical protein
MITPPFCEFAPTAVQDDGKGQETADGFVGPEPGLTERLETPSGTVWLPHVVPPSEVARISLIGPKVSG